MSHWLENLIRNLWPQLQYFYTICLVGLVLERLLPAQVRQPWKHLGFNLAYGVIYVFLSFYLLTQLQPITSEWIQSWGGWFPINLPNSLIGQLVLAAVYMLAYDFFYYWFHRSQHRFAALWVEHKLHHSEESLNVTTSLRQHWLEEPIKTFVMLLPFALIFDVHLPSTGWILLVIACWPFFIHMNFRLHLYWLTPVIAGPQLHRIHHSIEPQHRDRNFGAYFPVWDVVFGTYYAPKRNEFPSTGLSPREDLNGFWRANAAPFIGWMKMMHSLSIKMHRYFFAKRMRDKASRD